LGTKISLHHVGGHRALCLVRAWGWVFNGPRRHRAAHQPVASTTWCTVYSADHFLASDDIIATALRCRSKSAHFAPLQLQSILHASRQKIGSPVGWMIEDVMGRVLLYRQLFVRCDDHFCQKARGIHRYFVPFPPAKIAFPCSRQGCRTYAE
jgi:hypothetical protein